MKITVVALGKIGLPLAVQFASRGHQVTGADINRAVVDPVNRGEEPFPGEDGLAEKLAAVVAAGRLTATTDTTSRCLVRMPSSSSCRCSSTPMANRTSAGWTPQPQRSAGVCNPAPSSPSRRPSRSARPATGGNRLLERESGLVEGQDFHVVFSPERVLTGRIFADLRRYPKLVGGLSEAGIDAWSRVLR